MIKAGLDIGNSKISCVIADYKNTDNINILSIASVPNNNIKKNIILNFENLHDQIKSLVIDAEKQSQTKLNSINLNLSLLNSNSHYYNSEIELKNEKISELHLKKIINQSEYFNNQSEKFEIFNNITSYDIDNNLYFNAPIGNYSDNIKINFYKIYIQKKYSDNISSVIKKLKLNIDNYIPSPLSSSLSSLTKDEKELGTICIDLGHSTSSISVFENNKFVYGDAIGVGSNNVTLDIARGLSTTISSAERLKTLYGSLVSSPSDDHEIIEIPIISGDKNTFKQITRSSLNAIIRPRIEETLEMIWQKIKDNNLKNKKLNNVVLTGGGAMMDNIEKYVETIFASGVRVSSPLEQLNLENNFKKPNFCDIIGSILYDQDLFKIDFLSNQTKTSKKRGISSFFTWLDQYI
ncbi:MAG: cell division protein FtsA [Candidatus Pelagibacterales bacterium]|nr:MAG: cell division protein FtsA [Pelagibacterales bacterium]